MKVGIIIGSIREGRAGEQVGQWVFDTAKGYEGAEFEIIDLKSFNVPLLTSPTVPGMANRQYDSAEVTNWSRAIDACDAFIFVTPEYNHGVPGAFKNAVDSIGPEWQNKKVAFVAYGAANGVRAIEQWRGVVANFNMWDIRTTVELNLFTDFGDEGFAPQERRQGELTALLEQLIG
ncbi:NADPH-dependent FMN reductase [Flaviflexus equikiangi]|uniref:NAD(P)H-dependent oxidoreductase n=1 Tax=Flaviflexus equikiangi TaxID=2758573 RepID=A0ABS2THL2_9ACTO|nr:NAD(P)H-dependent oxidoreductase [Flaviflexus equikiangi]MBM9434151.1 NAD(P)H-dependent oxidoreductase [Flaviflexus equikiangi]